MAKKKPGNGSIGSVVSTPDGPATIVEVAVEAPAAPVVETPTAPVVEPPVVEPPVVEAPVVEAVEAVEETETTSEPEVPLIVLPGGTAEAGTSADIPSEPETKHKGRGKSSWKFLTAGILAQHMETKKLSAAKIAEQLGTTPPPVYAWKNGKTCPSVNMEIKLAQVLNIPVPEAILELAKKGSKRTAPKKAEQEEAERKRQREEQAHNTALELLKAFMTSPQGQADPTAGPTFFASMKKSLLA